MAVQGELVAIALIEKDVNSDVLWTWSYPSVTAECRAMLVRKCCLKSDTEIVVPFCFGQFRRQWFYLFTSEAKNSDALKKVTHFTLALIAKDFNPEKYSSLCKIMASKLLKTGSPVGMLDLYLSVFTKGSCPNEGNEMFLVKDFDPRKALIEASIKDVVNIFGVETILIYTALLLKKRVVVFCPKLDTLLKVIRALPVLVWHRQNWSILYPYVHLDDVELEGLKSSITYVAGFTDASVESRVELYDLFVNVTAGEIVIPPHATETFQMGKIHKDIAMMMLESAKDDEQTEHMLIRELSGKTKDLINNLKKLATPGEGGGDARVKLETLKERKLTTTMQNFLFNLAAAEGLV